MTPLEIALTIIALVGLPWCSWISYVLMDLRGTVRETRGDVKRINGRVSRHSDQIHEVKENCARQHSIVLGEGSSG